MSVQDPKFFLEADLELHQLITAAVHNQIISRFMGSLGRLGLASRMRTVALKSVRERSLKDHQAIVDALFGRDAEAAASIMQKHINNIGRSLNQNVVQESNRPMERGLRCHKLHRGMSFPAHDYFQRILQAVGGQKVMMTRITYKGQVTIPEHQHEAEQIMLIVQGRLWAKVGDEEQEVGPGTLLIVNSNVIHSFRKLSRRRCPLP